jgi:DNA invertase Pin-like site-specific DNA recombinase
MSKVSGTRGRTAMLIGYARTSTSDQNAGLAAQQQALTDAGCEKIFAEQVSSVASRDVLKAALAFLREGDTLMVTKPDRLARSTTDLLAIEADLTKRGVGLVIQSMGLDTRGNGSNPTTRLQLTILAAVAQFEREVMLERQRDGIAAAKAKGLYKGRKPTARVKSDQVHVLACEGLSKEKIAQQLGISRRSVFRILATGDTA